MKNRYISVLVVLLIVSAVVSAQGTLVDYERAEALQARFQAAVINMPGAPNRIGRSNRFWYSRTIRDGSEIIRVDTDTLEQRPAFEHERMAASFSAASGEKFIATKLPFGGRANLTFAEDEQKITFTAVSSRWECHLADDPPATAPAAATANESDSISSFITS